MKEVFFDQCVTQLEEQPIPGIVDSQGAVAGYGTTQDAIRYHNPEPIYSSIWMITDATEQNRTYSPVHTHPYPESNHLVGNPGDLVFRIRVGDDEREVESPATILIPPNVPHSANLVRGFGAFVVMRFVPEQIAASYELGDGHDSK